MRQTVIVMYEVATKLPKWRIVLYEKMSLVDEENIENQKPEKPCSGLRKELKNCILASDCVKMVGLSLKTSMAEVFKNP